MYRSVLVVALSALTVGCASEDLAPMEGALPVATSALVQGRLAGDLPVVGDFDQPADDGYGFATDDFLDLQLHASGEHGWAMIGVNTQLAPNGDALLDHGMVIGCSGADAGDVAFDAPADEAEVLVEPVVVDGEDALQVDVIATFGGLEVTGSAVVPVETGW